MLVAVFSAVAFKKTASTTLNLANSFILLVRLRQEQLVWFFELQLSR